MDNLEKAILFGKLKLKDNKKIYIREDCVFSINDKFYKKKEILEIVDYKIIGVKNNVKGFTEVKKSNETRNKITGAYE